VKFGGSVVIAFLFCAACGSIGPPLPPTLNIPSRVTDLSMIQRGSFIYIRFTLTTLTTEGLLLTHLPEADLRIGVTGQKFDMAKWLETAQRLPDQGKDTLYKVPAAPYVGKDVVAAVRLENDRGRYGGWSNFVPLLVTAGVPAPENLRAEATANGVLLTWTNSNAPLFRIYRDGAPLGDTKQSPYLDTTAEFGKNYKYVIQAFGPSDHPSESELSNEFTITPKDTFPPAIPTGLKTIIGTKSVELSWARNQEPDLAGYSVFRAEGDGPFHLVAEKITAPSYSDRDVKPGARYRYRVISIDQSGNPSAPSEVVEATLP
jgi:hypothetical protein